MGRLREQGASGHHAEGWNHHRSPPALWLDLRLASRRVCREGSPPTLFGPPLHGYIYVFPILLLNSAWAGWTPETPGDGGVKGEGGMLGREGHLSDLTSTEVTVPGFPPKPLKTLSLCSCPNLFGFISISCQRHLLE